jgi:hypothetical protein
MKILSLIPLVLLVGCTTTVPIKQKFPEAPAQFLEPCEELKRLQKDAKLSDIAKVVTENYTKYHECSIKNKAWTEWYSTQKKIFEATK